MELVPHNPAGEASGGRDQSAGYARRRHLSRDCGRGFNSRRLHLRKVFEPPSAPAGGGSSMRARASRVVRARQKGRPMSGVWSSSRIGPRRPRSICAERAVRCSSRDWPLRRRSPIHSTGGGRKIFSRPRAGGCRANRWGPRANCGLCSGVPSTTIARVFRSERCACKQS
jgi:hypothetical protein